MICIEFSLNPQQFNGNQARPPGILPLSKAVPF